MKYTDNVIVMAVSVDFTIFLIAVFFWLGGYLYQYWSLWCQTIKVYASLAKQKCVCKRVTENEEDLQINQNQKP